jgi:hypothetical protein
MNKQNKPNYAEHLMFEDADLTTPLHDEIVTWAASEDHILDNFKVDNEVRQQHWPDRTVEGEYKTELYSIKSITLEKPVVRTYGRGHGQVVGFVDIFAAVEHWGVGRERIRSGTACAWSPWSEWKKECIGLTCVAIEVKSRILSLGDLIRQINFYREYLAEHVQFIVLSPDVGKYKNILKMQNVTPWEYPR